VFDVGNEFFVADDKATVTAKNAAKLKRVERRQNRQQFFVHLKFGVL
jgi:hypothetical protein